MNDVTTRENQIEARLDREQAGALAVKSELGGVAFANMGEVMEFSKLMSLSGQAVPKHLRGQPGACLAVAVQALGWRMDPFAVANKSYSVNDRIAYEAQLVQAVIEQRAPIKGRIKGRYEGDGPKRRVVLRCISAEDGDEIVYESPEIGSITTKNSPLWKSDPDQQLWYYAARAMCRRHFPDVLLGVYAKDEIEDSGAMRDVTPVDSGLTPLQKRAEAVRAAQEAPQEADEPEDAVEVPAGPEPASKPLDPFQDGVAAARAGKGSDANPYAPDADEWQDWRDGWDQAQSEQPA